jgi:hypothetical protein
MAVDEALKAASIERCIELVGEIQVVAAVGDEDAKLALVERVGAARLLRSLHSRSHREGTGQVIPRGTTRVRVSGVSHPCRTSDVSFGSIALGY